MSEFKTGLIFDDRMTGHFCSWDSGQSEKVERYLTSKKKCDDYNLISRCHLLSSRCATEKELLLVHDKHYIGEIERTSQINQSSELEKFSSQFDGVFFNNKSYECALLAAGCTVELVSSVLKKSIQNGTALVRPPGHHAMAAAANGFCIFNNVAIAAKYALEEYKLKRILIVDFDVHHGQGLQQIFYNDPRVLYFSIHRYQHGEFWPHLRESNFDYIGGDSALGFNINVPLNATGLENADYLAIFHNVLLPVAYEFSPELVLISAGYDAAIGCPEGEMRLSPHVYPHFIQLLSGLANGKICVILEGGYCMQSLSEGVALTLRALLNDPCPLLKPCHTLNTSCIQSILNVISVHHPYWTSLRLQDTYQSVELKTNPDDKHVPIITYTGNPLEGVTVFKTREDYPVQPPEVIKAFEEEISELVANADLSSPKYKTGVVFDSKINQVCQFPSHVEKGEDALNFMKKLGSCGLFNKCIYLESSFHKDDNVSKDIQFLKMIPMSLSISDDDRKSFEECICSLNPCQENQTSAISINESLLCLIDAIATKICTNGFAVIRPSYHFKDLTSFEPLLSSSVIGAKYLNVKHNMKRILIIDWNIKKNNGIQDAFYADEQVLSISFFHDPDYFPGVSGMQEKQIGRGKGKGHNINIPFYHNVADGDYLSAFFHIVLPIAYAYGPEFIFATFGFSDHSQDTRLTPACFAVMSKLLSSLSNGKMLLLCEGNFYSDGTADLAAHCLSMLLNEQCTPLRQFKPTQEGISTIQSVIQAHKPHWNILAFDDKVPQDFNELSNSNLTSFRRRLSSDPVAIPQHQNDSVQMFDFEIETGCDDPFFCVTPLENCPHLELLQPVPEEGLNPKSLCLDCGDPKENWVCLHCYQVFCGRFINQHMVQHGRDMNHYLTLSYSDLSVWCYACESYIHNSALFPILEHAQDRKFIDN